MYEIQPQEHQRPFKNISNSTFMFLGLCKNIHRMKRKHQAILSIINSQYILPVVMVTPPLGENQRVENQNGNAGSGRSLVPQSFPTRVYAQFRGGGPFALEAPLMLPSPVPSTASSKF